MFLCIFPHAHDSQTLVEGKKSMPFPLKESSWSEHLHGYCCCWSACEVGSSSGRSAGFDWSSYRSLIIWIASLSAYSIHGDANMALGSFNEMLGIGVNPHWVTFTAVLPASAHLGTVDNGGRSFILSSWIMASMHQLKNSFAFLFYEQCQKALWIGRVEPSAKVWCALLNGSLVSRDVKIREVCLQLSLFKIEPENTVIMCYHGKSIFTVSRGLKKVVNNGRMEIKQCQSFIVEVWIE